MSKALVVRYGGYGDLLQASSVFWGLHQKGYEVTLVTDTKESQVVKYDPHIKHLVIHPKDEQWLLDQYAKYDKVINLDGIVEGHLLARAHSNPCFWPAEARERIFNFNYLERMHFIAGVNHIPQVRFYPTPGESELIDKFTLKQKQVHHVKYLVALVVGGSGVNKLWWGWQNLVEMILGFHEDVGVVIIGDKGAQSLVTQVTPNSHVFAHIGGSIRGAMGFAKYCDIVIGPETGIMHSVCQENNHKIVLLSHSTIENLTRDWINTISIFSGNTHCFGREKNQADACHMIHNDFGLCTRDVKTNNAQCMANIYPLDVFNEVDHILRTL